MYINDFYFPVLAQRMTEWRPSKYLPQGPITQGEGKSCAYLAITFAALSMLTVLAIQFPTYLTVAELRGVYGPYIAVIRLALQGAMLGGAGLALFSLYRGKKVWPSSIALGLLAFAQLMGGADTPVGELQAAPISAGVDWLIISALTVGFVFAGIEKLAPVKADQPLLRDQWVLDMKYFVINHLALGFFVIVTNNALNAFFGWAQVPGVSAFVSGINPVVQFVMIMVLIDLVQYWGHRLFHTVPFLWKFHAVHHSTERMDWLASSRMHILEPIVMRIAMLAPIFVLGFNQQVVNAYALFVAFQAIVLHANLKLELPWLERVLVLVRHHHWHHANDERAHNTNYAIHFPVLDRMFGTMCKVEGWPEEYGISEDMPDTVLGQAAYSFKPSK